MTVMYMIANHRKRTFSAIADSEERELGLLSCYGKSEMRNSALSAFIYDAFNEQSHLQ